MVIPTGKLGDSKLGISLSTCSCPQARLLQLRQARGAGQRGQWLRSASLLPLCGCRQQAGRLCCPSPGQCWPFSSSCLACLRTAFCIRPGQLGVQLLLRVSSRLEGAEISWSVAGWSLVPQVLSSSTGSPTGLGDGAGCTLTAGQWDVGQPLLWRPPSLVSHGDICFLKTLEVNMVTCCPQASGL